MTHSQVCQGTGQSNGEGEKGCVREWRKKIAGFILEFGFAGSDQLTMARTRFYRKSFLTTEQALPGSATVAACTRSEQRPPLFCLWLMPGPLSLQQLFLSQHFLPFLHKSQHRSHPTFYSASIFLKLVFLLSDFSFIKCHCETIPISCHIRFCFL